MSSPQAPTFEDGATPDTLLQAVGRHQDRAAFARLFGYFAPRLKSFLMRTGTDSGTAEELVQEVMLMVWRRAESFDPTHATASTWLFTIARNKRIDRIRRNRHPELDPDDPALVPAPPDASDRLLELAEDRSRLERALARLSAEQAAVVRLAYYEDKPQSQIATEQGLALGTVKSRLRLALERLRAALREDV